MEQPAPKRRRTAAPPADNRAKPLRLIKSCLQCRSRKVRCDQSRPCKNCVRREEPDLCQYTESEELSAESQTPDSAHTQQTGSSQFAHDRVIRPLLENDHLGQDTFSGLDSRGPCTGAIELELQILSPDVISIYDAFVLRAHQFVPIVLSLPDLAQTVYKYAKAGGGSNRVKVLGHDETVSDGQRALLSIVLAVGAQYSDLPRSRREELMRFFAASSFMCLRAANFLSSPSPEIIQVLLLHGLLGMNNFRCKAAWSLLGLTIRLATCIGVHQGLYKTKPLPNEQWKLQLLESLGWQDGLLSMCIGNVPTIVVERSNEIDENPTYPSAMRFLNAKLAQILLHRRTHGESLRNVLDQVVQTRDIYRRVSSKLDLNDAGEHSTQYLQRIAFRIHAAYTVSYLCKPALTTTERSQNDLPIIQKLLDFSTSTLIESLDAFATLLRLSVIAVRSWSFLHNGIGSALMLGVLGEFKRNQHVRSTVREILENLSKADMHGIASGYEWDKKVVSGLQTMYNESAEDQAVNGETDTSRSPASPEPNRDALQAHEVTRSANGWVDSPTTMISNDAFDASALDNFDLVFTQDWLSGFETQMF